ncbi:MAG: hypothetical protein LBI53_01355 [Candidatus Peribacteria bacterium]|jgi:hypothetical protein|nr:hypothetical protein [Candidatus Peribacteria bacterium]
MLLKIMADESGKKASEQEKQLETADSILFAMKNLTQKDVEGKIHAEEYNVKLQDLYDKLKKVSGNDKINIYATELFNNVQKFLKGEIVNREALLEKHREVLKERGEVEKAENAKGQSEETVKKTELDQQKKEQQKKQEKEIEEKKKELHKPEGKPLDTPDNAPAKIITTTSQPEPVQEG